MNIKLNEKDITVRNGTTIFELKKMEKPNADVVIYNGFKTSDNRELENGDSVVFIKKGEKPNRDSFEAMMMSRLTPGIFNRLKNSVVGVAGLGGLGSNVVLALARSGVGKIIVADFDVVEPSNLNRQAYLLEHLGQEKTVAMKDLIRRTNPYIEIETHSVYIESSNVKNIFSGVEVLVEAFDSPCCKAELVNTALMTMEDTYIIAGSGMAGYFSSNSIVTKKKMNRLYVVGDETEEAKPGSGLMAPRVNIAAAHQANMTLRILLGELGI